MRNKKQELALIKIGEIIKKQLLLLKISRTKLALELNTDEKHIRRIENGESNSTIISLLKIFYVLKIDIQVLSKIKIDKGFIED